MACFLMALIERMQADGGDCAQRIHSHHQTAETLLGFIGRERHAILFSAYLYTPELN